MEESLFNMQHGFAEGMIRGYRSGFLTMDDYRRMGVAETLEDVRTALDETDYAGFLQDEPSPLEISTIVMKAKQKMAHEFAYLKAQSVEPLVTFLDLVSKERMIENVVTLLQGTLNGKPAVELLAKADPMGHFEEMKTIPSMDISGGYDEIYKTILIETPVGPYFEEFLNQVTEGKSGGDVGNILNETDLELMKSILKKAWMEDFHGFCQKQGGITGEIMGHILKVEADFRVLNVTLNSLNTSLASQNKLADRNALYPSMGYLYPEGTTMLCKAYSTTTVRAALEPYTLYRDLFDAVKDFYEKERSGDQQGRGKSMEDMLFTETTKLYELAFEQQFHFGVFYAWAKLKEQEIRNIGWICNMVVMGKRQHADEIVPIFAARH